MTDVTVTRGEGKHPGDDIHEPLLATDAIAVARGRAEIDSATPATIIELDCRYRADIKKGDLVEVHDQDQGPIYRAKVVGITYVCASPVDIVMRLRLWRPR